MKHRLSDYLHIKNIEFKKGFYRCPNPSHADETISNCKCYDNADGQVLTCFVCGQNWDIYDVAGLLINSDNFIEQKKEVESTLGIISADTNLHKPEKVKQEVQTPVSIPIEKIDTIYSVEKFKQIGVENEYGEYKNHWFSYDNSGLYIHGVEVRYESENGKKLSFLLWWNGSRLKWTNPPRLIFGLNEIKPGLPFLIVEGPKTREIASSVLGDRFNVLTWNGGANNADKVDWKQYIPSDAVVYLYPDDDEPGQKAMEKIKEMLMI